ncbi:MAG: hypothetical protein R3C28_18850 [Pirellulaceae bacterium]
MWCKQCGADVDANSIGWGAWSELCAECRPTFFDSKPEPVHSPHVPTPVMSPSKPQIHVDLPAGTRIDAGDDRLLTRQPPTQVPFTLHHTEHDSQPWPHFPKQTRRKSNAACTFLIACGIAMFTCGVALIGFSFLGDRENLWRIGAPISLAGQAIILIGMVYQLDSIWRSTSKTKSHVLSVERRLNDIRVDQFETVAQRAGDRFAGHPHPHDTPTPQQSLAELGKRLDRFGVSPNRD